MNLLLLGAPVGSEIELFVEGEDENDAFVALTKLINAGFMKWKRHDSDQQHFEDVLEGISRGALQILRCCWRLCAQAKLPGCWKPARRPPAESFGA